MSKSVAALDAKNPLEPVITQLLLAAKLDKLPDGYKEEYRLRLMGQLAERIAFAALKELPASDLPYAEKLADEEKFDELTRVFQKNIPKFQDLMLETIRVFGVEFLDSITHARTTTANNS